MVSAPYPTPTSNETAGIFEFFSYVNGVGDSLYFTMILLITWVIIFVGTKQFSTSRAFSIASFMTMVMSIPLTVLDLVAPRYMYMAIILTAAGALWMKLSPQ